MLLRQFAAVPALDQFFGGIVKVRVNVIGVNLVVVFFLTRRIGLILPFARVGLTGSRRGGFANLPGAVHMGQLAALLMAGAGVGIVRTLVDMTLLALGAFLAVS